MPAEALAITSVPAEVSPRWDLVPGRLQACHDSERDQDVLGLQKPTASETSTTTDRWRWPSKATWRKCKTKPKEIGSTLPDEEEVAR